MKTEIVHFHNGQPLRLSKKAKDLPRPLTDWPPETEYEAPRHAYESRKWPAVIVALLLIGMAAYFYFRLH